MIVLWVLWVRLVVVVFLIFIYSLLCHPWSIRWVSLVGHSTWVICGQLIVWVVRVCVGALGARRDCSRGAGALGHGVDVGVC